MKARIEKNYHDIHSNCIYVYDANIIKIGRRNMLYANKGKTGTLFLDQTKSTHKKKCRKIVEKGKN